MATIIISNIAGVAPHIATRAEWSTNSWDVRSEPSRYVGDVTACLGGYQPGPLGIRLRTEPPQVAAGACDSESDTGTDQRFQAQQLGTNRLKPKIKVV